MMDLDLFQIAAERARTSVTEDEWNRLPLHEQSDAIYRELRSLDREIVGRKEVHPRWMNQAGQLPR